MSLMEELGEKRFLAALLPTLHPAECFVNGFGHDASIIDLGLEKNLAFKIDRAPHPVSVQNHWSDYRVWGRLAVVANVSDLIAAAAIPKAVMLSIVAPGSVDQQRIEEIVEGCVESCHVHGLAFLGGDTKEGPSIQVVGACLGTCDKRYYLGREVAKPGDHLVIAGLLGGFLGAYLLIKGEDVYERSDRESLLNLLTDPTARINEGRYMEETRVASASCDLSDGLADALSHFCKDTIGITIDEASLPMHPLAREAAAKTRCKLHKLAFGAGDWAVAFTVPEQGMKLLQRGKYEGLRLSSIGQFNESGQKLIKRLDGTVERAPEFVNEQFVKRLEDERNYFELFY